MTRQKMKDEIEKILRSLKSNECIGKQGVAFTLDPEHMFCRNREEHDAFEKALRSVIRKLKKEGRLWTWGDVLHGS